tara:strand:- start:657 stop:1031 length:375 start_codon:yes stop_codon:yes gene_type:complete
MKKYLSLLFLGLFLSGCYSSSLTMVGPATGVVSGKVSETAASTSFNYMVKKQTGKSPIEHVLSENQIKTLESNKAKVNPCEKNKDFCSVISNRIANTRKQLLGLNLQARIEKQHKEIFSKLKKN